MSSFRQFLVQLILLLPICFASIGDQSYVFRLCVTDCTKQACQSTDDGNARAIYEKVYPAQLPNVEDLLLWSCDRECRYRCMWKAVEAFANDSTAVPQFYGKWPFLRLAGIQEPASVLFSAANLIYQLAALIEIYSAVNHKSTMYNYWIVQYLFSINAWLWSTVFHAVDTPTTEKLDYFGAFAFILSSVVTLQRKIVPHNTLLSTATIATLSAFFIRHVYFMSVHKFDYGYNMGLGIGFGLVHCIGWIFWSVFLSSPKDKPHLFHCQFAIACLMIFTSLELLDFPPLAWIFDAHSLWHASSLWVAFHWKKFVIADCALAAPKTKA